MTNKNNDCREAFEAVAYSITNGIYTPSATHAMREGNSYSTGWLQELYRAFQLGRADTRPTDTRDAVLEEAAREVDLIASDFVRDAIHNNTVKGISVSVLGVAAHNIRALKSTPTPAAKEPSEAQVDALDA